ncbi:PTS sugar transporter subunit IIA [Lancefieldella parvula]|uniref:Ascorbate-specific PTS system EIIA component n=1 Tax=Lancefieldella parvula (strain ATCC 33793 / DSM 20469 / CCUG 32760 / JCM 10300 / KCTC 3663 / VPI 0546 / 1246) TaxID=521095 RepID=C8W8C0_LANP1|nr:PTS sugar transporter subunit IIA [Lancefieldella parvula]ACV51710.1 putative PTS IIA-like nitrogen-regulatory protein PtsN [Lancefieldella parvula DSM 20469]
MLSDFLTEDLVQLNIAASSWEDAIRKSVQPLVDNKKVTEGYVDDIIKGVNELGPYIVITEHVALPHARPESGVLEPAIGITVLKDSVEFGSKDNDPVKFLFPLAAKDSEGHLSALQSLVELLSDPDFFAQLEKAQSPKDVVDLVHAKEGRL